jgi:hypothetical protein
MYYLQGAIQPALEREEILFMEQISQMSFISVSNSIDVAW